MTWLDFVLGVLIAVGLLYIFYLVDRAFVYRKQRLGFWSHVTTTAFFPKRMVAYLLCWLVFLVVVYGFKTSMVRVPTGSLSFAVADAIIRLSVMPFLALSSIVVIVVLKIVIFPSEDDPDRHLF